MPDPTPEAFPQAGLGFPFAPVDPQGWWSPRADLVLTGVNAQIIASVTFSVASTPPPGAFLVAYLGQRNANSASVTLALWGLTWTTVKRQPFDSNDTQFLLTATVPPTGIPSNTGTAVVTFSGAGNGMGIQVWQFLGADQTFTPRIRQIVAGNRDASWTPFVNFTSPLIPSSAVVAFEQNDDGLAIAPPAGFTERIDQALSTNQMEGAFLYPAGSQGQTVTWGGAMTNSGVLAIEVQMEPFPTGLDPASKGMDPLGTYPLLLLELPAAPPYDNPAVAAPTVPITADARGQGRQDTAAAAAHPVAADARSNGRQDVAAAVVHPVAADARSQGRQDANAKLGAVVVADQRGQGRQDAAAVRVIPTTADQRGQGRQDANAKLAVVVRADQRSNGRQDAATAVVVVTKADQRSNGRQDVVAKVTVTVTTDHRSAGRQDAVANASAAGQVAITVDARGQGRAALAAAIAHGLGVDARSAGRAAATAVLLLGIRADTRGQGRQDLTFAGAAPQYGGDSLGGGHMPRANKVRPTYGARANTRLPVTLRQNRR